MRDTTASGSNAAKDEISTIEVSRDKELLQLVQAACKADKLQRALDLTRLMHSLNSMEAAAKIAAFYHLPGLQEKMGIVRETIEEQRIASRIKARESNQKSFTALPSSSRREREREVMDFEPRKKTSRRTARVSTPSNNLPSTYDEMESNRHPSPTPREDDLDNGRSRAGPVSSPVSKRKRQEPEDIHGRGQTSNSFSEAMEAEEDSQATSVQSKSGKY